MYSGRLREAKAKPSRAAGSILCSAKTVAASDPQTGQAREAIERSEKSGSVPPPGGPGPSEAPLGAPGHPSEAPLEAPGHPSEAPLKAPGHPVADGASFWKPGISR